MKTSKKFVKAKKTSVKKRRYAAPTVVEVDVAAITSSGPTPQTQENPEKHIST